MRSDYYVYILFRPSTGQPFYVGMGTGRRIENYRKRCVAHRRNKTHKTFILLKAFREGTDIPRVKVATNLTRAEAAQIEIAFIRAIGREEFGGPLTNLTDGGDGPVEFSPERKAEISAKISKALKGKKKSPGHVAAMVASRRKNPQSEKQQLHITQLIEANRGRKHTEEAKRKIGAKHKGRKKSKLHVKRWKRSMRKGYWSDAFEEKRSLIYVKRPPRQKSELGRFI